MVVLAAEVGGRWSDEAADFLKQLAKAKARGVPRVLHPGETGLADAVELLAGVLQRSSFRAVAQACSAGVGVDGDTPSSSYSERVCLRRVRACFRGGAPKEWEAQNFAFFSPPPTPPPPPFNFQFSRGFVLVGSMRVAASPLPSLPSRERPAENPKVGV